jgi:uncharacterized small protein (TIGR04563 family)
MSKTCIKFPKEVIDEVKEESARQDRSISWILQRAWILAKDNIKSIQVSKKC